MILLSLSMACKREDGPEHEKTAARKAEIGQMAPDFALKDQRGNPVSLSDFRDRIVVLEWTNTDCPFVQRHYREGTFKSIARDYEYRDVAWLAINTTHWATAASNRQWHEKYQLPYPILDDSAGKVGRLYNAKTTPHLFIINKERRLVYSGGIDNDASGSLGAERINYVRLALDDLMAGRAPQTEQSKPYG